MEDLAGDGSTTLPVLLVQSILHEAEGRLLFTPGSTVWNKPWYNHTPLLSLSMYRDAAVL